MAAAAAVPVLPIMAAITQIAMLCRIPTLVASPSTPSIRFKAFTAPNNQQIVKGMANNPSWISIPKSSSFWITIPPATASMAATTWPTSFWRPRSTNRSSTSPTKQISSDAALAPISANGWFHRLTAQGNSVQTAITAVTHTARTTATPPPNATERRWSLRKPSAHRRIPWLSPP